MYNLTGGILGWNGRTLNDLPRLKTFDIDSPDGGLSDVLCTGMDLERGAWLFYGEVLNRHKEASFARSIELLARAEEGHARLLYTFWAAEQEHPLSFDEIYGSMAGDIVEGGIDVAAMVAGLDHLSDDPCLDVVEMALEIEFAAYDLYRSMAHRFSGTPFEGPFLAIAQAEKEHMRIASEALQFCK